MNTLASTTTVHVIGKCPVKGCKNRRRVVIPDAPIVRGPIFTYTDWKLPAAAPYGAVRSQLSKGGARQGRGCAPPSSYRKTDRHPYDAAWFGAVEAAGWICREHDRFMVTVEVKGVVNEAKPCTAACRAAVGAHCDCVCGGEGHGSNYDSQKGI